MIVYKVIGNEIGPNGNGAFFAATKTEAEARVREWIAWNREAGNREARPPIERIVIRNRDDLAAALNDAMGYGAS